MWTALLIFGLPTTVTLACYLVDRKRIKAGYYDHDRYSVEAGFAVLWLGVFVLVAFITFGLGLWGNAAS